MSQKCEKIGQQAGAELCQAQHNLGYLPVAWNFAFAGAAYSASCGWSLKHSLAEALNQRVWGDGVGGGLLDEMHDKSKLSFSFSCRVLG